MSQFDFLGERSDWGISVHLQRQDSSLRGAPFRMTEKGLAEVSVVTTAYYPFSYFFDG